MPPKRAIRRRRPLFSGRANMPIKKILKDKVPVPDVAAKIDSFISKNAFWNLTISFEELERGMLGDFNSQLLEKWWYLVNNGAPAWFCQQVFWEFGSVQEGITSHGWPEITFVPSSGMAQMVLQVVRNKTAEAFPDLRGRALEARWHSGVFFLLDYCESRLYKNYIRQDLEYGNLRRIHFGHNGTYDEFEVWEDAESPQRVIRTDKKYVKWWRPMHYNADDMRYEVEIGTLSDAQ